MHKINDLSKSNQLAPSFFNLERLFAYDEHVYWPIRDGFLRFFQRLVILGAVPKGLQPLGMRLDTHPYISKVMQQCPCSAYFELRQPLTVVSVLELIVILGISFGLV